MAIKFDQSVSVSTIVSVVTMLTAVGGAWAAVQSQLTEQKTTINMIQTDRANKWVEIREDLKEIRGDMKQLSQRQDEILQRVSK